MFTGIITDTAPVKAIKKTDKGVLMTFVRPGGWSDMELGESIATNGACLTVSAIRADEYDCFVMSETLAKTSFGRKLPECVNLERALTVSDRFGGHFVQGHVDGVGTVVAIDQSDGSRLTISLDSGNRSLVINKGSITVNGVALTVTNVEDDKLGVALIPHTLDNTTIGSLQVGDQVNLEFDMIGKYVLNGMKVRQDDAAS